MYKKIMYVYALLLIVLLSGCIKRVDIKLPYEGDKIVINSFIQPDSIIYIRVTRSVLSNIMDDSGFNELGGATVTLEENGVPAGSLQQRRINGRWYFVSAQKAISGKRYTVYAAAAGLQPVMASDTLPMMPDVRDAGAQRNSNRVRFTLRDHPGIANYYRIRIFAYTPNGQPDTLRSFRLDPSFNNNLVDFYTINIDSSLILNDERYNGKEVNFVLQTANPIANTNQLMVEVSALTYNAYQYLSTLSAQQKNIGNIINEPIRVFSNVIGGYGVIAGINIKKLTFKVN